MNTAKLPVILKLKLRAPICILIDIDADKHTDHESWDQQVYDQLPEGTTKEEVLDITCFCNMCQTEYGIQLNVGFSRLHKLLEDFPPDLLLKFVTLQDQSYSALTEGWEFLRYLVRGLKTVEPYMKAAQTAAIEWEEKQSTKVDKH